MKFELLTNSIYRIRVAMARRFLVNLRRATHRMPVRLITAQPSRILVIAPHPDDEVIACGGSLLLHHALGSDIRVLFISDASVGIQDPQAAERMSARRFEEAMRVSALMKFNSVARYDFPDTALVRHESAIATRLVSDLQEFKPTQIFCPYPADGHGDHQACALAVAQAISRAHWHGEIFCYEIWSTLSPNVAIDISAVATRKDTAIRLYASQIADRDYASAILGLNHYRGLQHRVQYAEAFHRCDANEFQKMANLLNQV